MKHYKLYTRMSRKGCERKFDYLLNIFCEPNCDARECLNDILDCASHFDSDESWECILNTTQTGLAAYKEFCNMSKDLIQANEFAEYQVKYYFDDAESIVEYTNDAILKFLMATLTEREVI